MCVSWESCLGASESLLGLLSQERWAAFLLGCGAAGERPSPRGSRSGAGAAVPVPRLRLLLGNARP